MPGDLIRLRRRDLEWRDVEGEMVAADLASAVYLTANRSGTLLWPDLASGTTEDELVRRLIDAYAIGPEDAAADVAAFLAALAERGLLEH